MENFPYFHTGYFDCTVTFQILLDLYRVENSWQGSVMATLLFS